MGLIGNGRLLHKVRTIKTGGATTCQERQNYNQINRNRFFGEGFTDEKAGVPSGHRHPGAWVMPEKPGGLASRSEATVSVTSDNMLAVMGFPASGSTTITFDATGTGGLIAGAVGTATITFSSTAVLASVATIAGTANITFSESALLGALAGLSATGTITLTPTAISYAVGYLSGTSTNETEFSAAALAAAVWSALAASYNEAGTMGEKMNDAGAAGDPWSTSLPGTYTGDQAGKVLSDVKKKSNLIPGLL